jgi:hypothetical protein
MALLIGKITIGMSIRFLTFGHFALIPHLIKQRFLTVAHPNPGTGTPIPGFLFAQIASGHLLSSSHARLMGSINYAPLRPVDCTDTGP